MNKYGNKLRSALQYCSMAFLAFFLVAAAQAQTPVTASTEAHADRITPPPVPAEIQVEAGNELFLVGHGVGTQNYACVPCDTSKPGCPAAGVVFSLFTPQATLFSDNGKQLITHFSSPNPFETNTDATVAAGGLIRVTWQHSQDTSRVWAKAIGTATSSTDPQFVRQGAIPWLKLQVKDVGALAGPTGGNKLTGTTFIQRVNTFGGLAPAGCTSTADLGKKAFVPYTADYLFYKAAGRDGRNDY
ncbi:MAG: DUF3455 domain-containing protein [Blastocatellia bacterium]